MGVHELIEETLSLNCNHSGTVHFKLNWGIFNLLQYTFVYRYIIKGEWIDVIHKQ